MPREAPRRARPHSPVPVQRERPAKKRGPVTVDDVEALVRWLLETHRYTPWFDTEAAASYLRREPGTLRGWRSKGEGPRFYMVNDLFVRYHLDDLDAYVRGGRRRTPKWLRARIAARAAEGDRSLSSPFDAGDRK